MSYQVLARKYRPKSFETLVGQEHVVRALTHALDQQRLHHAYLFTGTRGVGKTTLSRILAKSLNCQGPDGNGGITAKPCGVCEACTAIDAGRFVDYIEMDAASNRGVDEMAQLLEQAVYAPSNARFKVYMIDEVHMLTNHAFNSMLKTLEEPPEHVKFILATTDPQKIPVTVLSRCLQFNLKQMPPGHIVGHLENILGQEEIAFEPQALRLLAQGAHGSMRDALSLTDQAIAYAAGKVTLEAVQGMLGALDQSYLIRVLDALAAKDGPGLLAVADEMATRSLSYNAALQDLGTVLHRIALAQTVPAAVPGDVPEREDILRLAGLFDAEEIQLFYQIAVHGRNDLSLAPDEYAGFTMTLLRMLAFRPGMGGAEGVAKVQPPAASMPHMPRPNAPAAKPMAAPAVSPAASSAPSASVSSAAPAGARPAGMSPARAALEAARNGGKLPAAAASAAASTAAAPVRTAPPVPLGAAPWDDAPAHMHEPIPFDSTPVAAQKKTESRIAELVLADTAVLEAPGMRVPASVPVPEPEPQVSIVKPEALPALPPTPIPSLGWDGNWPVLAAALPLRGVVQQLAQQSELLQCEANGDGVLMHLRIPLETLRSAGAVDKLMTALSEHFGKTVRVTTEIGAVRQTANAVAVAEREARQRQAEESMQRDPFVQTMMREFGATIVPGSIKPL
ncbi:DNA polymerase III subunit gamma/tau [Noviherbaspirillum aerium]|uniref:DNA polymerase III subunit gamma/tau n=1 Tax=Noviherbaspirillum aerium TaxID=2588497 RepID=UPI00124CEE0B|nr:DNA polymerase III subunit gamma/tau [Noviherbaspirillum aerium]